ncbi:hypothetical protein NEOLEDRAFT_1136912 [Neolentinus lepideus HHB14362 ss-1]|uniref:Uncharacterized protein n=1 Tax=Neolentinus lepideus HHB14362 ss-1 TaxID=1314782 RepID=A0A165R3K9_9AGAM|nr:hypothetical protein NEOLEDRAFT_1136912 [Neolentinus lepideus HHB14362 ss-1]
MGDSVLCLIAGLHCGVHGFGNCKSESLVGHSPKFNSSVLYDADQIDSTGITAVVIAAASFVLNVLRSSHPTDIRI